MSFNLPKNVKIVCNTLAEQGFDAYIVGGCVRDSILRRKPNDYDVTTNAKPDQIKEVFKDFSVIETGLKYGTLTFHFADQDIEVTTYRIENNYSDHRHPQDVYFTDELYEDLSRRDFTISALAYSKATGVIDYFDGKKDLHDKVLRCVGAPDKRFEEDALRILRAIRFAAQLNFHIEIKTEDAIYKKAHLLQYVSVERVQTELEKLLLADYCDGVLLKYRDLLMLFFDDIDSISNYQFKEICRTIVKSEKDFRIRMAILIHTLDYRTILSRFHMSARLKEEITLLCDHFYEFVSVDDSNVRYALNQIGLDYFRLLISMQHSCEHIDNFMYESYLSILKRIEDEHLCYNISQLAINGHDLIELGYQQHQIGETLKKAVKKVIENQLPNRKDILIEYFRKD